MSKGSRPINSSRRRGYRALTKKILIVGDGKSEEVYFNDWVGQNPNIKVISKGTGKTGIDEALRKAKGHERTLGLDLRAGDRIAIVMDLDLRYSSQDVADMVDLVSKYAYELYLSNPCFEVWLIDHFRKLTCYSTPEDLERTLREILQRGGRGTYNKSAGIRWDDAMLQVALDNASRGCVDSKCTHQWCLDNNPSTMVHLLVRTLM